MQRPQIRGIRPSKLERILVVYTDDAILLRILLHIYLINNK